MRVAQRRVDRRRRRLLDDLLVAALDRALALEAVDDVAVRVAEDLDLDVARAVEVALDEERAVAEGALGLAARGRRARRRARLRSRTIRMPLPPPPADALIRIGRPSLRVAAATRLSPSPARETPGTTGTPAAAMIAFALDLAAHRADRVDRRADEDEPGLGDARGEVGVLGEEAVAGVDRVGAGRGGPRRGCDRSRDTTRGSAPVRYAPPRRPRATCGAPRVGVGVHGDARDAHRAHRAQHAARDLAAIRDEDLSNTRRHAAALLAGRAPPCQRLTSSGDAR